MSSLWFALKALGGGIYLFGLGALFVTPLAARLAKGGNGGQAGAAAGNSGPSLSRLIPLVGAVGLLANYFLVLLVQSLPASLAVGGILAALGWVGLLGYLSGVLQRRRNEETGGGEGYSCNSCNSCNSCLGSVLPWAGIVLVAGVYAVKILSEPVMDWDAHIIWFFHGRMIYLEGALSQAAGWSEPAIRWTHPDYPKLVPALAAQVGHVLGYWNGTSPKLALVYLLLPALAWVFQFFEPGAAAQSAGVPPRQGVFTSRLRFVLLLGVLPFSLGHWLWNGYMDGYLAFYFALALLLLGRAIERRDRLDAVGSAVCLLMLTGLKNEGLLGVLVVMGSALVGVIIQARHILARHILAGGTLQPGVAVPWLVLRARALARRVFSTGGAAVALALLPGVGSLVLWRVYQQAWGRGNMPLVNDLKLGSAEMFQRIAGRLFVAEAVEVARAFWGMLAVPLGAVLVAGGLVVLLRRGPGLHSVFPAARICRQRSSRRQPLVWVLGGSLLGYTLRLATVYLGSPWQDLSAHLGSSVDRTLLPVVAGLWVAVYFLTGESGARVPITK